MAVPLDALKLAVLAEPLAEFHGKPVTSVQLVFVVFHVPLVVFHVPVAAMAVFNAVAASKAQLKTFSDESVRVRGDVLFMVAGFEALVDGNWVEETRVRLVTSDGCCKEDRSSF